MQQLPGVLDASQGGVGTLAAKPCHTRATKVKTCQCSSRFGAGPATGRPTPRASIPCRRSARSDFGRSPPDRPDIAPIQLLSDLSRPTPVPSLRRILRNDDHAGAADLVIAPAPLARNLSAQLVVGVGFTVSRRARAASIPRTFAHAPAARKTGVVPGEAAMTPRVRLQGELSMAATMGGRRS